MSFGEVDLAGQGCLAVAADLHTLLARAGESGPYVLAGHSSGGALAMTYAMMRRLLPVLAPLYRLGAAHLVPPSPSTALSPSDAARVRSFTTSPRGAWNMRDEQSELRAVFTRALTTFDPKPLAVVTSRENADGTAGWAAAQDRIRALSTDSIRWTAEATHVGLLDDTAGTRDSVRAITAVITEARAGSPLAVG